MSTRQYLLMIGVVTILAAGLAWYLERFKIDGLHSEVKSYLKNWDAYRQWEAQSGGS